VFCTAECSDKDSVTSGVPERTTPLIRVTALKEIVDNFDVSAVEQGKHYKQDHNITKDYSAPQSGRVDICDAVLLRLLTYFLCHMLTPGGKGVRTKPLSHSGLNMRIVRNSALSVGLRHSLVLKLPSAKKCRSKPKHSIGLLHSVLTYTHVVV